MTMIRLAALCLVFALCACESATNAARPTDADTHERTDAGSADSEDDTTDAQVELCEPDRNIVYEPHTYLSLPDPLDASATVGVADPHVIKVGSTWYLYGTLSSVDLAVWASEDLTSWRCEGTVWMPQPGTWNDEGNIWAPHVEAGADGRFYLYYSANMRIGVAVSDTPEGPFEEVYDRPFVGDGYGGVGDGERHDTGLMPDPEESAIDAFVLRASDGSLTFYFAGYTPFSSIFAVPMIDYVTLANEPPVLLIEPIIPSWEGFINEGPWVVEHEGRFHLMYSGNGADVHLYGVGVAIGDDPLGPFTKRDDNPILRRNEAIDLYGPGHHSLAPGADCDLLMFYHSKLSEERGWPRNVRYVPVYFDATGGIQLEGGQP